VIVKTKDSRISVKSKVPNPVTIVGLKLLSETALQRVWVRCVTTYGIEQMLMMDVELEVGDDHTVAIDPAMVLPPHHPVVFQLDGYHGDVEVLLKGLTILPGEKMTMRTADGPTAPGLNLPPLGG
jgi:hypothetical protein